LTPFAILDYSFESYLVSFPFWPRILMEMHPPIIASPLGRVAFLD